MSNAHDPWFILTPRADADNWAIDFRDNLGRRGKRLTGEMFQLPLPADLQSYGLSPGLRRDRWSIPVSLFDPLIEAINGLSEQEGPLPLFIDVLNAPWAALPWEKLLLPLLVGTGRIDMDRFQFIRLARRRWESFPPLSFPFRVMALGQQHDRIFEGVRWADWYAGNQAIQQHGINLSVTEAPPAGENSSAFRLAGNHMVICGPEVLAGVLAAAGVVRVDRRPRLFVVVDDDFTERVFLSLAQAQLPPKTSLLWLPTRKDRPADDFFREFVKALTHDCSLHEAVKSAMRLEHTNLASPALLVSDPKALRCLHLSKAVSAMLERAFALENRAIPGDVKGFLDRVGVAPLSLSEHLKKIVTLTAPIREAVKKVHSLTYLFDHETQGFADAAKAAAMIDGIQPLESELRDIHVSMASDRETKEALSRHQHRCVDVALKRRDPRVGQDPFVGKNEPVHPKHRYQLRVQIGRRLPVSLVKGDLPPVDPLLPGPEPGKGHLLHVAVFTRDFRLLSPTLKPLVLPELGASDPVFFELVVSGRLKAGHTARLRLSLYYDLPAACQVMEQGAYHNYLLQSFVLETVVVTEEKRWFPFEVTKVELEFSRTSRFANLEDVTPRLVSLGLNQGSQPGTHQLTVKRGGAAAMINLTEKLMDDNLKMVRKGFEAASRDPQNRQTPRFPEGQAVNQRNSNFDQVVRELALTGRTLYRAIWQRLGDAMQKALAEIAESSDQIIQIARFDSLYLFPWAILYDFFLPPDIVGQPDPEVCRGFLRKTNQNEPFTCERCMADCLHRNKEEVFCIYGFWGTRHKVEQILHTPMQNEDAIRDLTPVAAGAINVALGLRDQYLDNLVTDLTNTLGRQWVQEFQPPPDLLEVLWDDAKRPAILVIVSHYQQKDLPGEPKGQRIQVVPGQFLRPDDIIDKAIKVGRKWELPHSVVLLVACESAADDLATLGSFLNAFATARAGAVVGTESTIFSGLAARFSKEVAAHLLNNVPLGDAILRFRRNLLQELNPLGFVFTPYGDAELVRK